MVSDMRYHIVDCRCRDLLPAAMTACVATWDDPVVVSPPLVTEPPCASVRA